MVPELEYRCHRDMGTPLYGDPRPNITSVLGMGLLVKNSIIKRIAWSPDSLTIVFAYVQMHTSYLRVQSILR